MFCTLGVTRTPTTLLGGSGGGVGMVDGSGGGWVGEVVDSVMTVLAAMEVGGGMPVTSSGQLLLVGPEHERIANERHAF